MIQIFQQNLETFLKIDKTQGNIITQSKEEPEKIISSGFFFSFNERSAINHLFSQNKMQNPKSYFKENPTQSSLIKNIFQSSKSTFSLAGENYVNPQISALKGKKKKKDLMFINLSHSYISIPKVLEKVYKFKHLQILCLCDCGLMSVPSELFILPKYIKSLDLSRNYIDDIPIEARWNTLENLNFSENAFTKWPKFLNSQAFPKIKSIDFSHNQISGINSNKLLFTNLENLSLEYTLIDSFPAWISSCPNLKYLWLKGCSNLINFSFQSISALNSLVFLDISAIKINKRDSYVQLPLSLTTIIAHGVNQNLIPKKDSILLIS